VNRLRTYLGWKDVRKKAREDGVDEKDIESFEPDPNGASSRLKSQKLKLKIPWELSSIYNDVLVGNEENDDEEEDQDDKEAYEASEKRLRVKHFLLLKTAFDLLALATTCQGSLTQLQSKL
jgi:transcription initiation protein SPT3